MAIPELYGTETELDVTVNPLLEARRWVWAKLARRGGQATKAELDHIWDQDPGLLDDALRGLRDDGIISHTNGTWFVRG